MCPQQEVKCKMMVRFSSVSHTSINIEDHLTSADNLNGTKSIAQILDRLKDLFTNNKSKHYDRAQEHLHGTLIAGKKQGSHKRASTYMPRQLSLLI